MRVNIRRVTRADEPEPVAWTASTTARATHRVAPEVGLGSCGHLTGHLQHFPMPAQRVEQIKMAQPRQRASCCRVTDPSGANE